MKKIIRLTEGDLTKIVKRVISEMDYDDDDFEDDNTFESDFDQNDYDELLSQAREFLIDNSDQIGFEEEDVYNMDDNDVIDEIKYYDKGLYSQLQDMKYSKPIDADEPYDSIGGFSLNDLKRELNKK